MAKFVLKKDSTKAPFDLEKLKKAINAAAYESGLSYDESESLAGEIAESATVSFQGQEEISSDAIRERILEELDDKYPAVAESWRKYESEKGTTT